MRQLKDYGIENGAVLAHVTYGDEADSGHQVDYGAVGKHLEAARVSAL